MTSEQIESIIALGEGYHAEFKVNIPSKVRELTEEICAFANSAGGVLLIGVDDKNRIKGIQIDNAKRSAIQNSIGEISPKLNCTPEILNVAGLKVAVFDVPSGKNKPYVFLGAIYVRVGPNTQKLTTAEEMREFFQQTDKIYFDELSCPRFNIPSQMDAAIFSAFRTDAGFYSSITDNQILQNLQLFTEDEHFKSGAVLFFGSQPENFYSHAIIRCIAFRGNDKRFITDDKKFGGPRKENWEIPETVFKEAIINALSHRDYYEKGAVTTVEIFDERIEITNPGGLLAAVGQEFGRRSISRNPLVFGLFERMHLVEKVGSGIPRMQELMQKNKLPAPEFRKEGMFTIVLTRPVSFTSKKKFSGKLSENQLSILELIREKETVTIPEISKYIGINARAIEKNIKKLKERGFIERLGGRKDGKWRIL